ncbi:hypothetical protein GCM10020000_14870 [Streptomyces olivoverticillatus]
MLALAFGPLSLVQPLGALTIVFALPMAALFVHRPVGARGWRGAVLATAGLAGLLALTGPPRTESLDGGQRPVLVAAVLGAVALLAIAARRVRRPVVRGVVLATAAGAAFGMASVFTKAAAEDWDVHRPSRHAARPRGDSAARLRRDAALPGLLPGRGPGRTAGHRHRGQPRRGLGRRNPLAGRGVPLRTG